MESDTTTTSSCTPPKRRASWFVPTSYDWLGFDLDHTLVRYKLGALTNHIFDCCLNFMVKVKNYDPKLFERGYDPSLLMRGIILDKKKGNFIHINKHKVVVAAIHGTGRVLTKDEIQQEYGSTPIQFSGLTNERYWACTSSFEIPFFSVFGLLIDWYDIHQEDLQKHNNELKSREEVYEQINKHLFESMEYNFGDLEKGWYFNEFKVNIEKYVDLRFDLCKYLEQIRKTTNTKIFLLTNSGFGYSTILLNYSFGPDWKNVFDLIIYIGSKPYFFVEDKPFYELDNDNKPFPTPASELMLGKSYNGGNYEMLASFFGREARVCYFGDEVIGDIWIPAIYTSWDLVAVVEELEGLEVDLGLEHFMGLTPTTSEALHKHAIWDSFFHYKEHTSFWSYLIHFYSNAYLPSVQRLVDFQHNKSFQTQHRRLQQQHGEKSTGVVKHQQLSAIVSSVDQLLPAVESVFGCSDEPTKEMLKQSLQYKQHLRSKRDDINPLFFNLRK